MGELLNLVGLSTGVVLYAMLLTMVVRVGRTHPSRAPFDPLLLATSILGLVWNVCALPAYELAKAGIEGPFSHLVAIGFCALGFLPAVVVHSVLRGARGTQSERWGRAIVVVAYGMSGVAAVLQLTAALKGLVVPSPPAMRLLTYTFMALVLPMAAVTRGQPGSRRAVWVAALATFAVSALHLSEFHRGTNSWPVELVGHHASLPLALAILYQDYPFALADLFLKRAIALLAVVTLAFVAIATFGARSAAFGQFLQVDPRQVGVLVTMWVGTALLYPPLRRASSWFVDAVILHRPDYRHLRATVTRQAQAHTDVSKLLTEICDLLAPALSAKAVAWQEWPTHRIASELSPTVILGAEEIGRRWPAASPPGDRGPYSSNPLAALVIIPTSESPQYVISIPALSGGRRFLSDDLASLEAIAIIIARRIDAIRITDERFLREIREQEIGKLATEAELRALRAQVNPHFLFNALTTIGYLIQTAPQRALETLLRLTTLLRAVLRSESELTTLARELELIESYLDIERARFEHRLRVRIDVPASLRGFRVPPLVLQPIVENAVKHGIGPRAVGGEVSVRATIERRSSEADRLLLVVRDTGVGERMETLQNGRESGIGLRNVERRLMCQYRPAASLSIHSAPGLGTTVEIRVPADQQAATPVVRGVAI